MNRHAGFRSPSATTLCRALPRPSFFTACSRHAGGMSRSGSSCIGDAKVGAPSDDTMPVPSRLHHSYV